MTSPRNKKQRGDTQFPGITRHAALLGCHRVHLNLVLKGDRPSPRLISAYKALLKQEGREVPAALKLRTA
jgi:hypothetical protein